MTAQIVDTVLNRMVFAYVGFLIWLMVKKT